MRIRGARGLGDAIYLYPVIKHYIDDGVNVEVMTDYPEIFKPLKCNCIPRYQGQPDLICRYGPRYHDQSTTTYQDTLMAGQVPYTPLEIDYKWNDKFDYKTSKKICVIKVPAYAMQKKEKDTECLIPNVDIYQKIINKFKNKCYFILLGMKNDFEFNLDYIDEDLTHTDIIPKIMAYIDQSDIVITQPSYFLPMSEALNKKCFVLFSDEGINTDVKFYRYITPKKIINKKEVVDYAIDSEPIKEILDKFERLLDK